MEATIDHQPLGGLLEQEPAAAAPAAGINATYVPVKTPVMITGIQAHRIQELSSHLSDSRYNFVELFADIAGAPAAPPVGTSRRVAPGDMIGAAIATGDIVNSIGFGTVTQVYENKFVAFGHPFFYDGQSALPVYKAVVNGIVPNLLASYKSVSAYGKPIGTITKDLTPAIVGEFGAPPTHDSCQGYLPSSKQPYSDRKTPSGGVWSGIVYLAGCCSYTGRPSDGV